MQITDKRKAMAIVPLLRLGFRPFFLLSALLALIFVPLWVLALQLGWASVAPTGGWLAWHRHELVFGFGGGVIAGFLLTAVQSWTGQVSLSGKPLGVLVALWLLGRLAWWSPLPILLPIFNGLFFLGTAVAMARLLMAVRQTRNYPIVVVLSLLLAADLLTLCGVLQGHDSWQRQGALAAVWMVAGMITLIGGRVIPFFIQRGLGRIQQVPAWPRLDWALLIGSLAAGVLSAAGLLLEPNAWVGALLLALAAGHGLRLVRWFDKDLLRVPLLWSLYFAYLWMIVGCLGMGLWAVGLPLPFSQALHALTVGTIGGLILAMMSRVTLGHTGRVMQLPKGFALAYVLLNLAVLVRVFGPSLAYQPALDLASLLWAAAFLQFVVVYGPMLAKARVDGHPG